MAVRLTSRFFAHCHAPHRAWRCVSSPSVHSRVATGARVGGLRVAPGPLPVRRRLCSSKAGTTSGAGAVAGGRGAWGVAMKVAGTILTVNTLAVSGAAAYVSLYTPPEDMFMELDGAWG